MQPPLVSVLARDSVFTLALSGATAQKTGQVLQADLVLTGTLLALPSSFRLRAEMIRVADGTQIWVEDLLVSRDWTMGLELQVLERLAFRLGGHTSLDLAPVVAQSPINSSQSDAYEMFQRGHHEWQTLERHRMQDGMQHLLKAIELDPALLPAHIDLVNLCVTQTLFGFMPSITAADRIRRIASAIPDVVRAAPSILPALGWVDFHVDRDLSHAIKLFDQSAHLPHDPWITRLRAMFAISRHHFDEAAELMNQALEVDPYSPWLHARLAWAYHLAGKPNESMIQIEQSLKLFPQHESTSMYGALILAFNGDTRRAARLAKDLVDRTPYFDIATAVQAYALAREGDAAGARTMLERLQWLSRERFVLSSFTAGAFAALGDEENAISELRTSEKTRCPWFFQMLADPRLKSLQGHPEFERMRSTLDTLEINAGDYHVLCT
jgi:tetratricopeptide (TPR) repeat protein